MDLYKQASVSNIADYMRNQKSLGVSTCILVGAGASVSAGIPDARTIVDDLKRKYPTIMAMAKSDSYPEHMSLLAEGVRRELVRGYIENCNINRSYQALAALVKGRYVDRILTTNFDPLMEKALALYKCPHTTYDIASSPVFISGAVVNPSLVYLHGRSDGFLLLNTEEEVNSLMGRLKPVFEDSHRGRTWIVVGYSGNDKPVRTGLAELDSYQFGLYWVGYKNQRPSDCVERDILSKADSHFVGGKTSDTFFEELAASLELQLEEYPRLKRRVHVSEIDRELTDAGYAEAVDLFGVKKDAVVCEAFKIYHERSGISHLHRVFIRRRDFEAIEDEFRTDETINVIKTLIRKKSLTLHLYKSHQCVPTVVGGDANVIGQAPSCPAILHIQVSYIEGGNGSPSARRTGTMQSLAPVELLLTKYITPLNTCGFVLDRTPKSGFKYSKTAEDLYTRKAYRKKVAESTSTFFLPFSHINMDIARGYRNSSRPLPHSGKPDRLLRIVMVPESVCNYQCSFCCQAPSKSSSTAKKSILPAYCRDIVEALVQSGCTRVMLTGGEPLLCRKDDLLSVIKTIASINGIMDFWVCSNGSLLDEELCGQMRENGLKRLVVTLAAETNEKYSTYTRQGKYNLDNVLGKVSIAVRAGLRVRADVPLCREGIRNVKEFLLLISTLEKLGVKETAYFRLHKTNMNEDAYDGLFVNPDTITWELSRDNAWQVVERDDGQRVFYDGTMEIVIPALIRHQTRLCIGKKCGQYCQGTYAAYLIPEKKRFVLRGCHRGGPDNTLTIKESELGRNGRSKMAALFSKLWTFAYEEAHVEEQ